MTKDFEDWLMLIPLGWAKKFGSRLYDELYSVDPELSIVDMKEKWGGLDIYFVPSKEKYWDRIEKICQKYRDISKNTCIVCGCDTKLKTIGGWVTPICNNCEEKL